MASFNNIDASELWIIPPLDRHADFEVMSQEACIYLFFRPEFIFPFCFSFCVGLYWFTQKKSHFYSPFFFFPPAFYFIKQVVMCLRDFSLAWPQRHSCKLLLTTASRQQVPWQPPLPLADGISRTHRASQATSSQYISRFWSASGFARLSDYIEPSLTLLLIRARVCVEEPFYCVAGKVRHD